MSSVERRIIAAFIGEDRLSPTLNKIDGSLTRTQQTLNRTNQQLSVGSRAAAAYERQWRAFGVTARYALAGFGLYKIQQAISAYRDFQSELGSLNAVLNTTPQNIDRLGQVALDVSTKTAAPLNEVQQSIQNIAQSIPGATQTIIRSLAMIEAKGSRITGVDPRLFGSTVLGTARAFYGLERTRSNPNIVGGVASQFAQVALHTPRTTGQELAQYLPRLARAAQIARVSLPESLAMFQLQQQQGGNVSTNVQWLSQMLFRIRNPRPQAFTAYAEAFGGPAATRQFLTSPNTSGMDIIRGLLQHALSLNGVTPQQFNQRLRSGSLRRQDFSGPAAAYISGLGSTGALGGRQQTLAAFSAFAQQYPQFAPRLRTLQGAGRGGESSLDRLFNQWLQRNKMTQAAQAFSNATTGLLNDATPLINELSTGVVNFSKLVNRANRGLRTGAGDIDRHLGIFGISPQRARALHLGGLTELAGIIGGGILARRGLTRAGGFAGLARRIPGLGGRAAQTLEEGTIGLTASRLLAPIRGEMDLTALIAAMRGQANGTPGAPFWVVIHPLSAQTVPTMFGKGPRGPQSFEKELEKDLGKVAGSGGAAAGGGAAVAKYGLRGVLRMLGRGAARGAPFLAAETPALPDVIRMATGHNPFATTQPNRAMARAFPLMSRYFYYDASNRLRPKAGPTQKFAQRLLNQVTTHSHPFGFFPTWAGGHSDVDEAKLRELLKQNKPSLGKSMSGQPAFGFPLGFLRSLGGVSAGGLGQLTGALDIRVTLDPDPRLGIKKKTVRHGVVTSLWADGSPPPTSRGKQGSGTHKR